MAKMVKGKGRAKGQSKQMQ